MKLEWVFRKCEYSILDKVSLGEQTGYLIYSISKNHPNKKWIISNNDICSHTSQ
jgi:hypothetical protein